MTDHGVPEDDMPHLAAALDAILAADRGPGEADGPLRPVTEMLAVLRASPHPSELAGFDRALEEFRKTDGGASAPRPAGPARPPYRRARLFALLGAAAVVMTGAFSAAGYADVLPPALQGFAHRAIAAPAPAPAGPPTAGTTSSPGSSPPPGHQRDRPATHPPGGAKPSLPSRHKVPQPQHRAPGKRKPPGKHNPRK